MPSPSLLPSSSSLLGAKNVLLCHKSYHYPLTFDRYIFLVLFRCYRKLWSAKTFTSAACQTDKELALNGGNYICKTVDKKDQPGSARLDNTTSNHTPRDAVQEQFFPKTPSDVQNESITGSDLQSQPLKYPSPESPIPTESAVKNQNKQVSELVPSKELDEDFKEINLPNRNCDERQKLSAAAPKKSANFDKSYSEDETVLLKLKNEDQVHCRLLQQTLRQLNKLYIICKCTLYNIYPIYNRATSFSAV